MAACCMTAAAVKHASDTPYPGNPPSCAGSHLPTMRLKDAPRIACSKILLHCDINAISRRPETARESSGGGLTSSAYKTSFHCPGRERACKSALIAS